MNEQEFINQCMSDLSTEYTDEKQRYAVCKTKWDSKAKLTELDIITRLKKWLEKEGYTLDESAFQGLMNNVKIKKAMQNDIKLVQLQRLEKTEQEILVFPRGKFYFEKYSEWFTFDDSFFQEVMKSFDCEDLAKPFFDINHKYEESYGDITGYRLSEEGLYFQFVLNERGKVALQGREYRYISPSFGSVTDIKKQFHKWYLDAITLTNIPAFMGAIPEIQSQIKLESKKNNIGGNKMVLERLKGMLKLQSDVSDSAIEEAVMGLIEGGEKLEDIIEGLNKKVEELTAKLNEQNSGAEVVKEELEKLKKEKTEKEADDFILEMVRDNKMLVSQQDYWKKRFLEDRKETQDFFTNAPKLFNAKNVTNIQNGNSSYELTKEDKELMDDLNYDINNPKDVKLFLESTRGGK